MSLFTRQRARTPLPSNTAPVPAPARPSLWSDPFGKLATRALQIIVIGVLLTALVLGMQALTVVVIPIVLALIIASAFAPMRKKLRQWGIAPLPATILMLLSVVAALAAVGWLVVNGVQNQWEVLASQATEGFNQVVTWFQGLPFAPDPAQIDQAISAVTDFLTSAQFGSGAVAGVGAVANFFTGLVLMIVILFFFLKDGPVIWDFLLRPFSGESEERARRVGDQIVDTFGSYIRGTAAVAAVDAIGIGIGLVILKVPLALPLAVLVFLLAFIPLVGATLAGILAALVALVANGPINALIVVGVVILVNQLEGNLLQPVLMGRTLHLHALVILIALSIGTIVAGVLGAVLAVPLAAAAWCVVKVWDGPDLPAKWARTKNLAEAQETKKVTTV